MSINVSNCGENLVNGNYQQINNDEYQHQTMIIHRQTDITNRWVIKNKASSYILFFKPCGRNDHILNSKNPWIAVHGNYPLPILSGLGLNGSDKIVGCGNGFDPFSFVVFKGSSCNPKKRKIQTNLNENNNEPKHKVRKFADIHQLHSKFANCNLMVHDKPSFISHKSGDCHFANKIKNKKKRSFESMNESAHSYHYYNKHANKKRKTCINRQENHLPNHYISVTEDINKV